MEKISVLLCVYKNDSVDYLDEAISSVINQTLKPDQIVIVRDGEVPSELQDMLDSLKSCYPNFVKLIELEKNIGLSRALNIGLEHCDYEYIARMDSDDISIETRFYDQIQVLESDSNIALVSSWYDQYNEDMTILQTDRKVPECHNDIVSFSKRRTPFNHSCALFRKSAVISSGKYPEITSFCEDWWVALKLIKSGYHLANVQKVLLKVRGGESFYNRRTGFKYASIEFRNLVSMYKHDLLSTSDLIINILIRLPTRLFPDYLVKQVYNKARY